MNARDLTQTYALLLALACLAFPAAAAEEPVDWEMVNRIRDEGFHHSRVMATIEHLTDVIGPRLTGSPAMKEANEWTRQRLEEWGLENAHLEAWGPFGRGWTFSRAAVHMLQPRQVPLLALPQAWTPGTGGPVRGPVMKVNIEDEEDFEKYRGKLAGKILFLDDARDLRPIDRPVVERFSDDQLAEMEEFEIPGEEPNWRPRRRKSWKQDQAMNEFLSAENALATVEISSRDGGLVRVGRGGSREVDGEPGPPALVMAAERYNWIVRLLGEDEEGDGDGEGVEGGEGVVVELEIDVRARFHDDDLMAYNTVAEIPGSDRDAGLVMAGAHLDSYHAGTGATDNAAGCAVMMEAMRILKALGVRPRRTIRIALWSGEEQGYLGSRAYVEEHFATIPVTDEAEQQEFPARFRDPVGEVQVKSEHAGLAAYFNYDNGSGKIRGIYNQENVAAGRIFASWLEPFHDLGARTVASANTGGTDHTSFDRVGLPGFQFIQDDLDYWTRTHHSSMDVLDHVVREDLIQSSVVVASFLYHAAMRPEPLPRKPLPHYGPERE